VLLYLAPGVPGRRTGRGPLTTTGAGISDLRASDAAPDAASERSRRRLLLLSYHFPPENSVGSRRWQKLARFAHERGWGLDVIAVDAAGMPAPDWEGFAELPDSVRVYGVPEPKDWSRHLDPVLVRASGWLRSLQARVFRRNRPTASASPGEEKGAGSGRSNRSRRWRRTYHSWRYLRTHRLWATAAAEVGRRVLEPGVHRAVITCGPPHMVHDAGRQLAAHAGLPLVMDLRDLWTLLLNVPEELDSPLWFRHARDAERRAVAAAALVVTNTDAAGEEMRAAYPEARDRIVSILNGYDDEPAGASQYPACFIIAYAGSIYIDRDPRPLLRATGRIVRELGLGPEQLRVEFMGDVWTSRGTPVATIAEQEGVGAFLKLHPIGARPRVRAFLSQAALLVSLPQDISTAIPSKIFEYTQYDAWLLAFADPESATDLLLRGTGADVVALDDFDKLVAVLRARYLAYARGERPARVRLPVELSRQAQAQRLFDELERRLGVPRAR